MKLTRSTSYALVALDYLIQKHPSPVAAREIAAHYHLPLEYLQKVLQQLVRNKLLSGVRGPQGGFSLARPANRISLLEIYEAVEGELTVDPSMLPVKFNRSMAQNILDTYSSVQNQTRRLLKKATLIQLTAPARKKKTAMTQATASEKKKTGSKTR